MCKITWTCMRNTDVFTHWKVVKGLSCSTWSSPTPILTIWEIVTSSLIISMPGMPSIQLVKRQHSFPAEQGVVLPKRLALFSPSSWKSIVLGDTLRILSWVVLVGVFFNLGFALFFWHSIYPHRKHSLPVLQWTGLAGGGKLSPVCHWAQKKQTGLQRQTSKPRRPLVSISGRFALVKIRDDEWINKP